DGAAGEVVDLPQIALVVVGVTGGEPGPACDLRVEQVPEPAVRVEVACELVALAVDRPGGAPRPAEHVVVVGGRGVGPLAGDQATGGMGTSVPHERRVAVGPRAVGHAPEGVVSPLGHLTVGVRLADGLAEAVELRGRETRVGIVDRDGSPERIASGRG